MHMYTHAVILQLVPTAVYTPGLCVSAYVQVPSRYLLVHDSSPDEGSMTDGTAHLYQFVEALCREITKLLLNRLRQPAAAFISGWLTLTHTD